MRVTVNVECSPEEARAFLGLPNLEPINELMVERVKGQLQTNMDLMDPEQLLKNWFALGDMVRGQFVSAMTAGVDAASAPARAASEKGSSSGRRRT